MKKEIDIIELLTKNKITIMGIAALWIVLLHFYDLNANLFEKVITLIASLGNMGVDVFLLLSGIGIMVSLNKNDTKAFYIRRIKRVVPSFLITGILFTLIRKESLSTFIKSISGYYFFTKAPTFFCWYGIAIIILYAISPLIYKLYRKVHASTAFSVLFLIYIILYFSPASEMCYYTMRIFINRLPTFFLGTFIGSYIINNKELKVEKSHFLTFICLIVLYLGFYLKYLEKVSAFGGVVYDGFTTFIPLSMAIVFLLAFIADNMAEPFKKFFNLLGKYSFEIYCIQAVIMGMIFLNVYIYVPLIVIIGILWGWGINFISMKISNIKRLK